ncbi:hypothetical protein [Pseudomonas oryzihabitans]|uniref:hypothetical protein n=1 Tax=Pseudomonas oryzihabitans TaxID=47885 RepID=UPI00111DF278|nr:hypothetical protein [Pseudomonas psychrotolerans]
MNPAPQAPGRQLALFRLAAVAALVFIVNKAFIVLNTGRIQTASSHINFNLSEEHLWAGYLFLSVSAGIFVLLLFINHAKRRKFSTIAKALGFAWFVPLSLAVWLNSAT